MPWRQSANDADHRISVETQLLAAIESDPSLTEHWAATAPDVQRAYLGWATKPRFARKRRQRANAMLTELSANDALHYQPRTASWTDVLGF